MFSCEEVAAYYRMAAARSEIVLSEIVVAVIASSTVKAKTYIGTQQDGWEPLSSATIEGFRHNSGRWIEGKEVLGFGSPPDFDPLLRSGLLRESIEGVVEGLIGIVGSNEKRALWQELGTDGADYPISPRPFLAKALQATVPEIEVLCEEAAVNLLVPKV